MAVLIEAAAQLPGIGMEIRVIAKGIQPFADQAGFASKEAAGTNGRRGWFLLAGLGGLLLLLLIQGRGLHRQGFRHQLQLLNAAGQIHQGPLQVVLKSFDAAAEAIGLAGEVAADLLLELIAALLQFFDFPFQGLALLLQFLQGQLLPARFRRWCAFHCAMCSSQQCDSGAGVF